MRNHLFLSPKAFRALAYLILSGPNCNHQDVLPIRRILKQGQPVDIADLAGVLDEGPISTLVIYSVLHKKPTLEEIDIAKAYSIDHLSIVQNAGRIFWEGGDTHEYFKPLKERGFVLKGTDLLAYLYSDIAKPGYITGYKGDLARVATKDQCELLNVFAPGGHVGQSVLVHFAAMICKLPVLETTRIYLDQTENYWYRDLGPKVVKMQSIDYRQFCGGDATEYAMNQLRSLKE